ncbi:MAG: ChbG/HpnK family deacetylase [Candidatus Kuenenia sp.]|nr:ChbG/HpnK family deacetylase [Candidatus Kuenenia hertensis]
MLNRSLIINADGYGITAGINRAIEECIEFGTVRSVSANVNYPLAMSLPSLARKYPWLSVGCHLNPIIGKPVLPLGKVRSLINEQGEFFYKEFNKKLNSGHIRLDELRQELFAQIDYCRELAGSCFTHVDCHMGKHRLPRFYPVFLEAAKYSGTGRIRTHRYMLAMESQNRSLGVLNYFVKHPMRIGVYFWNLWLRHKAQQQNLVMPDWWVCIGDMGQKQGTISLDTWISLLKKVPLGISEFVVHPAYLGDEMYKWTTYISQREDERKILTSEKFRDALLNSNIQLVGYRNIKLGPLNPP